MKVEISELETAHGRYSRVLRGKKGELIYPSPNLIKNEQEKYKCAKPDLRTYTILHTRFKIMRENCGPFYDH